MSCRHSRFGPGFSPGKAGQAGAALVIALLVFAIATALIVAMERDFTRVHERAGSLFIAEQGDAYLRGAEGLAQLVLLADYDADEESGKLRDHLNELWAQQGTPYPLEEGGWLQGNLEDLQGRFNLNTLVPPAQRNNGDPRFTIAQAQFMCLLQSLGEQAPELQQAIAVTEAVGDWLDTDSNPLLDGAEDDHYYGVTPSYRAANRPMASVSELRAVSGVSAELYAALAPWVTVWPQEPQALNIHTAPLPVLRSIGPDTGLEPMSSEDAQALYEQRQESGFADMDDFLAHSAFSGIAGEMGGMKTLLGENSSLFLLRAQVQVAGREMRLYSVLERKSRQVNALVRASGSL